MEHARKSDIVFDSLKSRIINECLPGEKFLTVREIMKEYSVSSVIVQKIMANLQAVGLLVIRQGAGAFVAERQEATEKARNVAFVFSEEKGDIENDLYHFNVFKSAEKTLSDNNCNVIFKTVKAEDYESALESLVQGDISGVALSSSLESSFILDKARESFDHVVLYGIEKTGFNCVLPDRKAGAYQAVRYLAGLGHKKIAFMKSPGRIVNRLKTWHTGYLKAIREFDLMESESLIWEYEEIDFCISKLIALISKKDSTRPTGIFIPWAGTAQDIEIKMIDAGINVPGDISIVTFNDRFLQKPGYPGVTTVSASNESLGEETAEMLLSLINYPGAQTSTTVKILPVSLIERESCGRTKE